MRPTSGRASSRSHALLFMLTYLQQIPYCFTFPAPRATSNIHEHHNIVFRLHSNNQSSIDLEKTNAFSATIPFNYDIARTLFALSIPPSIRHRREHSSSPFEDPSCARSAERMLNRMIENRQRSDGKTVCPDKRTFSLVAGSFGRLRYSNNIGWDEESQYQYLTPADKIEELLKLQLQLCHRESWPIEICPSIDMYNRLLKRLALQSRRFKRKQTTTVGSEGAGIAYKAWLWLQLMKSPVSQDNITDRERKKLCPPDAITYAHVIDALSSYRGCAPLESQRVSVYESIHLLAEEVGIDMNKKEGNNRRKQQDRHTPEWFLTEAEALLSILEAEYNSTNTKYAGDNGWSKDKITRALVHGYRCLLEGWGRYAVTGAPINPTTSNYDSLTQSRVENAVNRAHELLCKFEGLAETHSYVFVPTSCYSSVILALSISDLPSAANIAEDVLQRLIEQSMINIKEMAIAFSGCIAVHAKNNNAPNAEKILNQMLDLYNEGDLGPDFVPEARAFGTCIALWAKHDPSSVGGNQNKKMNKYLPQQQRIVNADRAESILSKMENFAGKKGFNQDATPYNIVILARVQTIDNSRMPPKIAQLNYDEKRENEQIMFHGQELLDHMEFDMGIPPDPYTYSILLNAWVQLCRPGFEEAADYAEALLRRRIEDVDVSKIEKGTDIVRQKRLHKVRHTEIWPNVKHYSSVLKAHAKTKSAGGAKKALALLSEMEQRYYEADVLVNANDINQSEFHVEQRDAVKPDLVCYSIVIDAFANSRLPEASSVALRLLRAVIAKYEGGDVTMKPNTIIYTAVIMSLVYSPLKNGSGHILSGECRSNSQMAWSLLDEMKKNGNPPNSYTYNYIINCCSHDTDNPQSSFKVAIRAFQELRKTSEVDPNIHPDSFTFAFMIKACTTLLPPCEVRTKVIIQAFKECCQSGYLNDAVLDRLWRGLPVDTFYKLIEEKVPTSFDERWGKDKSPIKAKNLPALWSRSCTPTKNAKS